MDNNNKTENKMTSVKKRKKFADFVKDNLEKIIIVGVSLFYISQGLFVLVKKDTTIWDILGSIGESVAVGLMITACLNGLGLKDGRLCEEFLKSLRIYGESKAKATKYFPKLPSWCEYKNAQSLEIAKKEIIQDAGMNWKAYKFGYYDEPETVERLNDDQKLTLKEVEDCKVPKITYREMLSDLPKKNKTNGKEQFFGETENEFKRKNLYQDFFLKLMLAIIGGLYALTPLLTKENMMEMIAGLIWNTFQIVMWLSFGVLKYNNARSFMINEYRQTHLVQKAELFNEFVVTMETCPEVINNYDEDAKTDKYIQEYFKKLEDKKKEGEDLNEQKDVLD